MDTNDNKDVKLSAEVEPFIPQKKGVDSALFSMSVSGEGGGGATGAEPAPIPSYLITCYPFVQENQPSSRQLPVYNGDLRWQQPTAGAGGPFLAYPILSSPQPPVSNDYTYYQIMPAPCPPMMGFYQHFPGPYPASLQTGVVNPVSDCDRPPPQGQAFGIAAQRGRGMPRAPVLPKQQQVAQPMRARRPVMRSVAVQKEVGAAGPDGKSRTVLLVDAAQQTDFPGEACGAGGGSRCVSDRVSPLQCRGKVRRRRPSQPTESSSEHGASEADIDSDSGYCSPKHNQGVNNARTTDHTNTLGVEAGVMTAVSWVNVTSQATQKPWADRTSPFHRSKMPDQRNYSQEFQMGSGGHAGGAQRGCVGSQKSLQQGSTQTASHPANPHHTPEPLFFQDEEEFPDLTTGGTVQRNKPDQAQLKMPKPLLDNLPENSPINIVQTPIPITTSVPKRAKSQRKKALAAALATAQEYSEISMEQKKLQEALIKAAGRKSRTPVQLDLGDMLAALEKQQQAMKARQLNNTKPLSYTVGTTAMFHSKDVLSKGVMKASYTPPHNMLDSTAPRMKRGKEREIPKVKRPTALKKVILKEREVKKAKLCVDQPSGVEEQQDDELNFTDTLTQEGVSQEDNGLSMASDASLSPASQNSPYSITPVSQGSPASSGIGSPMATSAITKIHSRRFREYCNQVLNKEIDESVTLLLQELVRFQERVYQKEPTKAKAKRRLVMGLREVTKHMKLNKIRCVIISPNCEKIQAKGGLDEALYNVIAMAREQEIPFVFALGRKALGRCVNKLVPVSVVGIFNYSGAESLFNRLVSLTEEARRAYKDMVSALEQEQAEEALKNVKKVSHHMGHSRNPSAASAISFCSVISEPISEVNEKEYETNWRTMVESCDAPEPLESDSSSRTPSVAKDSESNPQAPPTDPTPPQPAATPTNGAGRTGGAAPSLDREEGRVEDRLEWASQQSTETGSPHGSCRDLLNSSITSTSSTLVPGMLEEAEEDEDDEDDYAPEPILVEVPPLSSMVETWVSTTLENLQLSNKSHHGSDDEEEEEEEEDVGAVSDEDELDSSHLTEPSVEEKQIPESQSNTG
ncbi:selenocysteine insertion sequence-binding protein 2-like isoform X1 [Electrophorus electricus]|uniref:selenocysteine insertion sequence-binding protein 2-like isoform X1 n=1 Tax=Electrophorus electricus TaxID=8005 RepID=UPI0015CFD9C8|nr:selenocysteine insertion sequence-binding protein 2-like isoform X1 [Electrophorus electricus]